MRTMRHAQKVLLFVAITHQLSATEPKIIPSRSTISNKYFQQAEELIKEGNIDKAFGYYQNALHLTNDSINAEKILLQIGIRFQEKHEHQQAIAHFIKVIQINPKSVKALHHCGRSFFKLNQLNEAINYLGRALANDPNNATIMLELANALNMINETELALSLYRDILSRYPPATQVQYNYAYTLKKLNRLAEALPLYEKLIQSHPDHADAHFGLALTLLAMGNFKRGFEEYEWRWKAYHEAPISFTQPVWDGSDLQGKTILVYSEQGLGDTFQYIRYLKLLKDMSATVIFKPQNPLVTILKNCPYIDLIVSAQENLPDFDYQIALMSLPLIFGTEIDTVPASIPYLYADPKLITHWKEKLAHDTNFKVGICWQGNANYHTQILRSTVAAKSMQASDFAPLAKIEGVSFYSLQKVNGEDQLAHLPNGFIVHDFGGNFDGEHGRFMDTAALIKNIDLVITIDTSVSHFAAALGAPVWILLPNPADWRWMVDRLDTPWYPNMRLFRQQAPGDWKSLMERIKEELIKFIKTNYNAQET